MPYTAAINWANPAAFMFLVDQSGAMTEPSGGSDGQTEMKPSSPSPSTAPPTP